MDSKCLNYGGRFRIIRILKTRNYLAIPTGDPMSRFRERIFLSTDKRSRYLEFKILFKNSERTTQTAHIRACIWLITCTELTKLKHVLKYY